MTTERVSVCVFVEIKEKKENSFILKFVRKFSLVVKFLNSSITKVGRGTCARARVIFRVGGM